MLSAATLAYVNENTGQLLVGLRGLVNTLGSGKGTYNVKLAAIKTSSRCIVAKVDAKNQGDICASLPGSLKAYTRTLDNGDVQAVDPILDVGVAYGQSVIILSGASVQSALNETLLTDLLLRGIGLILFLLLSLAIAQSPWARSPICGPRTLSGTDSLVRAFPPPARPSW